MYRIKTTSTFDRDIKKLDHQIAKRIIAKIELLAINPQKLTAFVKHLPKDLRGLRKYRIGDWRILFWLDHKRREIVLYGVDHRRSVYKKF